MYLQNRLAKLVATGTLISFLAASCGKTNSTNNQPQSADTNPAPASAATTPPQQKASYLGVWREIDKDGKELDTVIKVTETTAQSCTLGNKPEEKAKVEEFSINPLNSTSFQRLSEDKQKVLETYNYSESDSSKYLERSTERSSSTTTSEQTTSSTTVSATATTTANTPLSTKFIAKETTVETDQLKSCFPDPTKPDPTKPDPTKPDPTKPDPTKPDPTKPDPTKPDPVKPSTPIVSTFKNIIDIVKQTDQKVKATNNVGEKIVAGFEAAGQVACQFPKTIGLFPQSLRPTDSSSVAPFCHFS
ncbi:hypothetical protein [Silvanigrella sp.]|jgi:hypothetical protein|uniref:hypothetical protein n=1 Tax=Silvanigrella sp. TaxID=2024976 RepID=UPI0037C9EDA8